MYLQYIRIPGKIFYVGYEDMSTFSFMSNQKLDRVP